MNSELRLAAAYIKKRSGGLPLSNKGARWFVTWPAFPGPTMVFTGDDAWLLQLAKELKKDRVSA